MSAPLTASRGQVASWQTPLGARWVLAHVRGGRQSFTSGMETERARSRSTRRGREILDRAHDALPAGVEPDERVEMGTPANRLAEMATEVGAALIVAGTRGRGRLASALRGSVSHTLVRRASCPVLIVSDRAPVTDPTPPSFATGERSTIVAGLDDSPESPVAAAFASELAQGLGDRLLIVRTHAAGGPRLRPRCRRLPQ
jgi:nucleotide-binding universal stress UspA family protein